MGGTSNHTVLGKVAPSHVASSTSERKWWRNRFALASVSRQRVEIHIESLGHSFAVHEDVHSGVKLTLIGVGKEQDFIWVVGECRCVG